VEPDAGPARRLPAMTLAETSALSMYIPP
jgi:hypothetical protein